MTQIKKCYYELVRLASINDRYKYLRLSGQVGRNMWKWDRHFNQKFYHSIQWKRIRDEVIVRDLGCDLGVSGFEIGGRILIHHMNPISMSDLTMGNPDILDPEFLICTSEQTHQAIHYGDESLLPQPVVERYPGDTRLWTKPKTGEKDDRKYIKHN